MIVSTLHTYIQYPNTWNCVCSNCLHHRNICSSMVSLLYSALVFVKCMIYAHVFNIHIAYYLGHIHDDSLNYCCVSDGKHEKHIYDKYT